MTKIYSKSTYENSIKSIRNQIMQSSYSVKGYCEIPDGVLHFQGDIPGVSPAQARYYIVYMIRDAYGSSVWINPVFFVIEKPQIKRRFENREIYFNLQRYPDNKNRIFVEFNDYERKTQRDTKTNYGDLMPKVIKVDVLPISKELEYNDYEQSFVPTFIDFYDVEESNQINTSKVNKDYLGGFTIFTKHNSINKILPIVTNSYALKTGPNYLNFENKPPISNFENKLPSMKLNAENYKGHISKTHLDTLRTYILDLQEYCNDYEKGFIELEKSYEFNNVEYVFEKIGSIPININSNEDISCKDLNTNIKLLKSQLKYLYDLNSCIDYELDINILKPVFDSVLDILVQLDDFYVLSSHKKNPSKSLSIILSMYESLADISFLWNLIGAGSYDCYVINKFMTILKYKTHLVIMYLLVDLDKVINDHK